MDFSYLDKKSYKDIKLYNNSRIGENDEGNSLFFIRKYKVNDVMFITHRHTYIQINYVINGSGFHYINNGKTVICKGDIFIIPPYVPHKIVCDEKNDLEIIEFEFSIDFILPSIENIEDTSGYLDFAYLEPFMVAEESVKPRFNLRHEIQLEVEKLLYEALNEFDKKKSGYELFIKALLLQLLVITGRAYTTEIKGTEEEKILHKFKKTIYDSVGYIMENYNKNITLDEVASAANYSRSHFSYLFKVIIGKTFVEYLNGIRIEKAVHLLKHTNKNVIDISLEVGFNSITNFNKTFKAVTGRTPKDFR